MVSGKHARDRVAAIRRKRVAVSIAGSGRQLQLSTADRTSAGLTREVKASGCHDIIALFNSTLTQQTPFPSVCRQHFHFNVHVCHIASALIPFRALRSIKAKVGFGPKERSLVRRVIYTSGVDGASGESLSSSCATCGLSFCFFFIDRSNRPISQPRP